MSKSNKKQCDFVYNRSTYINKLYTSIYLSFFFFT